MRTMKKFIKFVKIILLIIISGCNTTVINKQELESENMKTEEIIKMIDEEVENIQEYDEWCNNEIGWENETAKETMYLINHNKIIVLKELKIIKRKIILWSSSTRTSSLS